MGHGTDSICRKVRVSVSTFTLLNIGDAIDGQ
jgi:hypothetical protein